MVRDWTVHHFKILQRRTNKILTCILKSSLDLPTYTVIQKILKWKYTWPLIAHWRLQARWRYKCRRWGGKAKKFNKVTTSSQTDGKPAAEYFIVGVLMWCGGCRSLQTEGEHTAWLCSRGVRCHLFLGLVGRVACVCLLSRQAACGRWLGGFLHSSAGSAPFSAAIHSS